MVIRTSYGSWITPLSDLEPIKDLVLKHGSRLKSVNQGRRDLLTFLTIRGNLGSVLLIANYLSLSRRQFFRRTEPLYFSFVDSFLFFAIFQLEEAFQDS